MKTLGICILVALSLASTTLAAGNEHEICCKSCMSKFATSLLRTDCMHGCRLYGMIFLAHDSSVDHSEISSLCSKSCSNTPDNTRTEACSAGCASQERVFRQNQLDKHSAKLAVMLGLNRPPMVHSPAAKHWRLFDKTWSPSQQKEQNSGPNAWLHALRIHIRPMSPGSDGSPRYWVEISEHAIPLRLKQQPNQLTELTANHHPFAQYWLNEYDSDSISGVRNIRRLSNRTRTALRYAACGFLIASLIGMLWLCCSLAKSAKKREVRLLHGGMIKQVPPSIQSGDIVIQEEKKMPLLIEPGKVVMETV